VNHKAFTPEDIDRYKRAMNHPGARTATVNYYRAALRYAKEARALVRPLPLPTLLIWGEQDPYLGIRLTQELQAWVGNLRIERLADASHWVQNDAPQRVNQLLLEFLRVR
jgi:pimeloyl-ACP methyl ester carboxylesterase